MNKSVKFLLFEAYRRNEMRDSHENSKPLNKRCLGLGTAAAYKPALEAGLMTFHNGRTPPTRCQRFFTDKSRGYIMIKCELWIGTRYRFFKWGDFPSISSCRKYIRECITCYHEIRRAK